MKLVKLLSMIFLIVGFWQSLGFVKCLLKRGILQRSGREVLRDEMFKN